ncbi:toxin-antitoxin system YwqK family antitoxin [Streptomyces sp. NPDC087511]|uniref:toxin-antitoxin system YwqK family antitoxin n=1 Tax=Streptomyces sp. NPDC087511 TaxID=3365792 RepID=UPI00380DC8C8
MTAARDRFAHERSRTLLMREHMRRVRLVEPRPRADIAMPGRRPSLPIYQKGALVSLVTYRNGIEDGPSKEWHVEGTLRSDGVLRGGFPVGESKDWHPDGQLATRVLMSENGLRQLEITEWDDKGNLTREWRAEHG